MRYLKKASYEDIIGNAVENQFHSYENLLKKYKEFELFLTKEHLDVLFKNKDNKLDCLIEKLKDNGAVIAAIHCSESKFKTCNESGNEISSNYLSLCEVIQDDESKETLKK